MAGLAYVWTGTLVSERHQQVGMTRTVMGEMSSAALSGLPFAPEWQPVAVPRGNDREVCIDVCRWFERGKPKGPQHSYSLAV